MILRIPGVEAWQNGVRLGFFPGRVLNGPARFWKSTRGSLWVDLPTLLPDFTFLDDSRTSSSFLDQTQIARQFGFILKADAPAGPHQSLDFLWNLFGPGPKGSGKTDLAGGPFVLVFSSSYEALPLIREILRMGDHGDLRFQEEYDHFWLFVRKLSRFIQLRIGEEDGLLGLLFQEVAPGFWIESGYGHPLGGEMSFSPGRLILVNGSARVFVLEEKRFLPFFDYAKWRIDPPVVLEDKGVPDRPLIEIPLKLVPSQGQWETRIPDLWIIDAGEMESLWKWIDTIDPQIRQSFRCAVLSMEGAGSHELILLYRYREVLQSGLGEIPGRPFEQSSQLTGLFLPFRTKIHPDPGPGLLRKLVGMLQLDQMAWLETQKNGDLKPFIFPANALGGWDLLVRFTLEKTRQLWEPWVQSLSFSFETIPTLMNPPLESSDPFNFPEKPNPTGGPSGTGATKISPPVSQKAPKITEKSGGAGSKKGSRDSPGFPVEVPPQNEVFTPAQIDLGPLISQRLLKEFDESTTDWGDPIRVGLIKNLAKAWRVEGQAVWAGKAWLLGSWNAAETVWNTPKGLEFLLAWNQAESQVRGLAPEPDIGVLTRQGDSTEFRLNRMNWFLTGLLLQLIRKKEVALTKEEYQILQATLIHHGPHSSQRLVYFAWKALAKSQGDPLIATRGAERQLYSLLEMGLNLKEEWPEPLMGRDGQGGVPRDQKEGLIHLLEKVTGWMESHGQTDKSCMTLAMVRWSFAYGFARLGAGDEARTQARLAQEKMVHEKMTGGKPDPGELATLVSEAYGFRVDQALAGKAASGPLPREWLGRVSLLDGIKVFPLDYTREMSQILEPHQSVHPFGSALSIGLELSGSLKTGQEMDPDLLAGQCLTKADGLGGIDPLRAVSGWVEILDRILLLPTSFARTLLDRVVEFVQTHPLPGGDGLRLGTRVLIAASYFQYSKGDFFQQILEGFEDPKQLGAWMGGTRTLGMNKELFVFCVRRLSLLGHLDRKAWVCPILDSLSRGLDLLPSGAPVHHGRFLVDAARLRFLPEKNDETMWFQLERQLREESRQLAGFTQRRNEPWLAYCSKLVAYIHAAGAGGPVKALERLSALFQWIFPLRDHFATNPHHAGYGPGCFAYYRNQIEWIEAMVLAVAESSEPKISDWVRQDEAMVRKRIREMVLEKGEQVERGTPE